MAASVAAIGSAARAVLALLVALVARILAATLRVTLVRDGAEPDGPLIYAFLHGQQLPLLRYPRPRPTAAVVSLSRDGSLQAGVLGKLGFGILRGSSSSGGARALGSSLGWLGRGRDLALAVDGPRGPAGRSKPGVIWLSQKARARIVPVACHVGAGIRLERSWDRFLIPWPFARVRIVAGAPWKPWEKDWTEERKLAYLDSLIGGLAEQAATPAARPCPSS